MDLLDVIECKCVSTVYSGNEEDDNKANTELYLKLYEEGKEQGFYPVLVEKEIGHYIYPPRYGYDMDIDHWRITKVLKENAERSCFDVWLGRIICDCFLDGCIDAEDVAYELARLEPPDSEEYHNLLDSEKSEKNIYFNPFVHFSGTYEDFVFVLLPIKEPWEALAWIPMGGFNWCPEEVQQIALAKGLYELFGARIVHISWNSLIYYVPESLFDKEKLEKAAKILVAADSDVYDESFTAICDIRGSHNWEMWWD